MGINFPNTPAVGTVWPSPLVVGQAQYTWDGEKWVAGAINSAGAVRYDIAQALSDAQTLQARTNIAAAPYSAIGAANLVINGGMIVSQAFAPNNTAPMVAGSSHAFADMFYQTYQNAGAIITGYNGMPTGSPGVTPPPGFTNGLFAYLQVALSSLANSDYLFFIHKIEGTRLAKLGWGAANPQPLTYAFMVYTNDPGIGFLKLANHDATRCYYAEFNAPINGWNFITGIIPGDTTGTWRIDNNPALSVSVWFAGKGATIATPGAWGSVNTFQTTNSQNIARTNTTTVGMTGLLLVPGQQLIANASMLARCMRPFAEEQTLCYRYYEMSGPRAANFSGNTNSGTSYYVNHTFKVAKRAAPTVTGSHSDAFGFAAAFGTVGASTDIYGFTESRAANATQNGSYWFSNWWADARM